MRLIFALVLISLLPFNSWAQFALGADAGITVNYFKTDLSGLSDTKIIPKAGGQLSITGQYQFNHFILSSGLGWIQKSYTVQRTGEYSGLFQTYANNYLEIPLTIGKIISLKKCSLIINAGGFGGWWTNGSVSGSALNILSLQNVNGNYIFTSELFKEKYAFDKRRDNRMELGATANAMLTYQLYHNVQVYFKCLYDYSLTDQQKEHIAGTPQKRNQLIGLMIGTNFNL